MKVQMPKELFIMYAVAPCAKNAHLVLEQRSEKTQIYILLFFFGILGSLK